MKKQDPNLISDEILAERGLHKLQNPKDANIARKAGGGAHFVSMYTEEVKDRAVLIYLLTGSAVKTARTLDLPGRTVQSWVDTDWFKERLAEARKKYNSKLDGTFSAMLRQIVNKLDARLKHGDEVVTPSGKVVKRQVPAKELSSIMTEIYKTLALLRGEPTSYTKKVTVKEKLESIAEGMKQTLEEKENDEKSRRVH